MEATDRSWRSDWRSSTWLLAATVTLETADVAWAPSYFDGDDGDARPLPLSERLPALAGARGGAEPAAGRARGWSRSAPRPRAAREVAPARVRFRAPPLA